jgi:hypothetical protein
MFVVVFEVGLKAVVVCLQGFLTESLPEPYKDEMKGLAEAAKLELGGCIYIVGHFDGKGL